MEGKTTYRTAYIPFCPKEYKYAKQPIMSKTSGGDFSCAPFAGMSTYRGDYWPKPIIRVASLKPTVRGAFSDAPFADRTTYRNDYNPFHFNNTCEPCVPAQIYNQVYPGPMYCCEGDSTADKVPQEDCPQGYVPPMRSCSDRPLGPCPACPEPACSNGICADQQEMLRELEVRLECNAKCGGMPPSGQGSQRGSKAGSCRGSRAQSIAGGDDENCGGENN
jgi:hypothetical protein